MTAEVRLCTLVLQKAEFFLIYWVTAICSSNTGFTDRMLLQFKPNLPTDNMLYSLLFKIHGYRGRNSFQTKITVAD